MRVIETPARTGGQAHQDASAGPAFYAFLVTHNRSEHGPRYSGSGRRHGRRLHRLAPAATRPPGYPGGPQRAGARDLVRQRRHHPARGRAALPLPARSDHADPGATQPAGGYPLSTLRHGASRAAPVSVLAQFGAGALRAHRPGIRGADHPGAGCPRGDDRRRRRRRLDSSGRLPGSVPHRRRVRRGMSAGGTGRRRVRRHPRHSG